MNNIEKYNQIVENIVNDFAVRFAEERWNNKEGERVYYDIMNFEGINQGPVELGDMYFSIDDIIIAEHHQIPCKIFEDYYDLCLSTDLKPGVNLINYYRKNINSEEYEKQLSEDLKRSEEKVKKAKVVLFESILGK